MTSDTLNYTNLTQIFSECTNTKEFHLYLIAMTCAYSMDSLADEIRKKIIYGKVYDSSDMIMEVALTNEQNERVRGYDIYIGYSKIELRRIHDSALDWSRYDRVLAECFYSKIIDDNYGEPVQVVDNVEMDFGSWGCDAQEVANKIPFDWRKFDQEGMTEIFMHYNRANENYEEDITIEDIDLNKFLEVEI